MADERVETCLTCESAVGFGSSQSLGSPGSHETPTGRFGSMGAAPRSEAQQVPEGETRLVGTAPSPDVMELAWWALRPGCLQAGRLVNTPGTPSLVVVRPGRASLRSPRRLLFVRS